MDVIKKIQDLFPEKTILSIVDYQEYDLYVVRAIPTDRLSEKDKWLDGMYSVDNEEFKILGGFNPMMHEPKKFFTLPKSRVLYERTE